MTSTAAATETTLDPVDLRALKRAMTLIRTVDPDAAAHYRALLAEGAPWEKVAVLAAARCQWKTLRLMLHQREPMRAYIRDHGVRVCPDAQAGELLERMLANGISQFEPDPQKALARRRKRAR